MCKTPSGSLTVTAATILWMLVTASEAAEPAGELWETTSQMSMDEFPMPMPLQTLRVCSRKDWKQPPGGTDPQQNCRSSEMKISGSKTTWTVQCAGPPAMTGVGEITRQGADSYTGLVKFTSEEMTMTLRLAGRKIGTCDNPL